MTLQTYKIFNEITTTMKQLANIYSQDADSCSDDFDKVYFKGKTRGLLEGVTEVLKIMSKYETQEGKAWKNSINK